MEKETDQDQGAGHGWTGFSVHEMQTGARPGIEAALGDKAERGLRGVTPDPDPDVGRDLGQPGRIAEVVKRLGRICRGRDVDLGINGIRTSERHDQGCLKQGVGMTGI